MTLTNWQLKVMLIGFMLLFCYRCPCFVRH